MKKIYFFMILMMLSTGLIFGEGDTDFKADPALKSEKGFELFLNYYIGLNVSVYLITNDIIIEGKLIEVYSDGIVLKPIFKENIFILKKSISFVEIKKIQIKEKQEKPGK